MDAVFMAHPMQDDAPYLPHVAVHKKGKSREVFQIGSCRNRLQEYARNAFDNLLRNRTLKDLYEENGKALGMEFTTEEEVLKNASGSADFGNVTFVVAGIHPFFYIGSKALNHTEEHTVASGDDKAQFHTLRTAKALAMMTLDVLMRPELQQKVKQEF